MTKRVLLSSIERPVQVDPSPDARTIEYGSDALAETLSRLLPTIDYIALNPGSSYRGLHDSLINYGANASPQMLLVTHEEHAVSLAHGYAKASDRAMAVALHANVGLQHAVMAIYNAFCDRVPMIIIGAGGPFDATERRPWIDHIHTSGDQAALIRNFCKWDDQPATMAAAMHSLVRANHITNSVPHAPVYVCLDVTLQEQKIAASDVTIPDTSRYVAGPSAGLAVEELDLLVNKLRSAKRPLFLLGRVNRNEQAWKDRIELIEALGAAVITDLKNGSAFPYPHPRQPAAPNTFMSALGSEMIRKADVIVVVDWIDFAGTLKLAFGKDAVTPDAYIVTASLDAGLHNGWSKDSGNLPPADLSLTVDANRLLASLHARVVGKDRSNYTNGVSAEADWPPRMPTRDTIPEIGSSPYIFQSQFANAVYDASSMYKTTLIRANLGWNPLDMRADHPLSYLGGDGGAGLASGPGQCVGSALALMDKKTGLPSRLPMAILGDGDTLMGNGAMWTAAHYRVPCLFIIANNCSFYNDEVHQERVAKQRGRPVENKHLGMSMVDPEPNLSMLARSYGLTTAPNDLIGKTTLDGQVQDGKQLKAVIRWAAEQVMEHAKSVLVDVRVRPDGYGSAP